MVPLATQLQQVVLVLLTSGSAPANGAASQRYAHAPGVASEEQRPESYAASTAAGGVEWLLAGYGQSCTDACKAHSTGCSVGTELPQTSD